EDGNPISAELKATPLAITAFSFSNPPATGTIDHTNKTIKVVVPNDTNVTNLVATFTAPRATVKVGDTTQASGTTANDFTDPVMYDLTTSNDASTCSYEVTVKEKLATPSPSTIESNTTTSSFKIQWGSVSGAESYLLDVSTDGGFSSFLNGYHNKSLTTTSCTVNGLSANTTYYYRVKAVDSSDPDLNSDYSNTIYVTTLNIPDGKGSTEINSDEPTTIDVSSYVTPLGTVIPKVIVDPIDFTSTGNDIITVSMSYGIHPEGLQYNLAFNNRSIGIGTYVLYYTGLLYDPTDVRYRLNGGELQTVTFSVNPVTESGDKSITVTINNLPELSKATYNLQIVLNDDSGQTLPVVLSSFTATLMVQGKVRLEWVTQSASGLTGFRVLRNTVAEVSTAIAVSSLIEANNTSTAVPYSFIDNEIPCNGTYYYWLQIEGQDGSVSYYGSIAVEVTNGNNPDIPIPLITALNNPFPNPFNPSLTIPFDLSKDGRVTIKIYNLKGQLIKNLIDEDKKASNYRIVWDGKDNNGHIVSAGTYIVRMNAPEYNSSRKIVMVK
ncbi:MAG TPA: FlgD immunoglobulin-like domain containing protein, partial [Candidatus Cloacimonas sp.]|nr:FlgD immunoglobulin-like domain containing protein [Candidatus Cloacimonas sp.]